MELGIRKRKVSLWHKRFEAWRESGESMLAWCQEQKLSYRQFAYYKRQFSKAEEQEGPAQFIELKDRELDCGISIECQGLSIYLKSHFDEEALMRCIRALKSCL